MADTVNVEVPAKYAVPLIKAVFDPEELRLKPDGNVPLTIVHVYGPTPPLAVRVCEYAPP